MKDLNDPKSLAPDQTEMLKRSMLIRFSAIELIDILSSLRCLKDPSLKDLEAKFEQCLGELSYEPHAGIDGPKA